MQKTAKMPARTRKTKTYINLVVYKWNESEWSGEGNFWLGLVASTSSAPD